jgi:hypothetical protein
MNFEKTVNEAVSKMIEDGVIEKMINEKLESCIASALDSQFRTYSDFGKAIEKKVETSLALSLDRVDFPVINELMANQAKAVFEKLVNESLAEKMQGMFREMLDMNVKNEITWEDLEGIATSSFESEEVEVEWEQSDDRIDLIIKHPEYDWYNIQVVFYNHRNEGWNIGYIYNKGLGDKNSSKDMIQAATTIYSGLSGYLLKAYCNRSIFVDLEEHFDESFYVDGY